MKNIREQEEDPGKFSSVHAEYDISLTPIEATTDDVIKALSNIDNYGKYISNLRNTTNNLQKDLDIHFGPNIPSKRKFIEKQTGVLFPIKTKQAIDDFVRSKTSKPNLLKYVVKDGNLIFPQQGNPTKEVTKNIIKTVLGNVGINYKVRDVEMKESKTIKFADIFKEGFQGDGDDFKDNDSGFRGGSPSSMFKIEPKTAFKIYDILKKEYPEIGNDHTASSFYHLLNKNL